jgi:hypothetical protein
MYMLWDSYYIVPVTYSNKFLVALGKVEGLVGLYKYNPRRCNMPERDSFKLPLYHDIIRADADTIYQRSKTTEHLLMDLGLFMFVLLKREQDEFSPEAGWTDTPLHHLGELSHLSPTTIKEGLERLVKWGILKRHYLNGTNETREKKRAHRYGYFFHKSTIPTVQ